jgi:hypothetical protein
MVPVNLGIVLASVGLWIPSTALTIPEPTPSVTTAAFLEERDSPQTAGYIGGDPSMCF